MKAIDWKAVPSPSYIVDERLLRRNLEILKSVQDRTGCDILLALKGFSMFSTFPMVREYLKGITSSSLFEARLGYEEFGKEVHAYAPAYAEHEIDEYLKYVDHIVFNSFDQLNKYKEKVQSLDKHVSIGLRVNPGYSEVETELYDPCALNSRLGIPFEQFRPDELDGVEGIHFHAMCEQNSDVLERIIPHFEEKYGPYLHQMKWVNFGGGHHITRPDYDVDKLVNIINYIKKKYDVHVILEPGEAIALNTGYLVTTVLDVVKNGMEIAILDTSATCHMPDVLEMPYRPQIIGASTPNDKAHTYRLGGMTCLAGDVIGDYSFDTPLKAGDKIVFTDMAHYTMVKNHMFNGVNLPSICLYNEEEGVKVVRQFGYEDYRNRLS
ncbi:carboxynorspermidine decarboxylase [Ureibacillus massiliensis 4400831 = CIP 108448 = CCUG 49529]|uniref:Carboxynorspermidine decarboxylase n=1 Tax=Ureibacillus massiliensis 4400831 = CIP 108448 = CCUG 49529 TaxID=1211035 RepID=A0A0A3JSI7_9BACL|nr:carboxynorspermidine decarboxylase [Ureibacillus massiliensis]KGR89972.1 carboxynorspermidine decarboxylase [Ureibacillus massiliensis 4400831 = CIP 108448 = CCUG 49529]